MTYVLVLLIGLVVSYVGYVQLQKRGGTLALPSDGVELIVSDGVNHTIQRAKVTETGNLVSGGVEYPAAVCRRVSPAHGYNADCWLVALEPLALANHRTLEQARRSVVLGSLFKPSSDLLQMLQYLAVALVIAAALYTWSNSRSTNALYASQVVELQKLTEQQEKIVTRLSQPLNVVPSNGAPVPPPPEAQPVAPEAQPVAPEAQPVAPPPPPEPQHVVPEPPVDPGAPPLP